MDSAEARARVARQASTSSSGRTCYATTETAQQGSFSLSGGGLGRKDGTFINSEPPFGLLKKVARAPGQALADFKIFNSSRTIGLCRSVHRVDFTGSRVSNSEVREQGPAVRHTRHSRLPDARRMRRRAVATSRVGNASAGVRTEELRRSSFRTRTSDSTSARLFEDGRFFPPM